QRAPLRKSLIPSRRHCRQTASRYLATFSSLNPSPLRRPAAVVRDRGHVPDRSHLEPHRLQRADGRLAAGAGALDADFHRLEAELHRLPRRVLGGGLGGERRALAGALEAHAARAGPGNDVAGLVGQGDDGVVEGGLHVGDAHADLLALALAAALAGRRRLLFWRVGHVAGSLLPRRGGRRGGGGGGGHGLLLDHHALALALARARVGVGALAADGQALAVTDAAVGADVHQALHVHGHFAAQVALDLVLALDDVPDAAGLVVGPRLHALVSVHARVGHDPPGRRDADPVDVLDGDEAALLTRQVDSGDACHIGSLPLTLLVARVLADHVHDPVTAHDLAVLTANLYRRLHFHDGLDFLFRGYLNRYVIRPRVKS